MMYCRRCGEYTTKRDAFGDAICAPCYQAEDEGVEAVERAQARRFGYDAEYYAREERAERTE